MEVYRHLLFFVMIATAACTIPDYIHVCQRNNPNLANCIKGSIEALRPRLKTGIPELEVPSIEPFSLDFLSFHTSSDASSLSTNVTKIQVWGASDFQIQKLVPTLTQIEHSFQFEVTISQLRIKGEYQINSKILLIQLKGSGPFNANISDFHFECLMKGRKIQKGENNHLKFAKMKCNADIGKTTIVLENLFEGHPVLGKATNDVINDNTDVLFEEIKPSLVDALRDKFTDIANNITLNFKYEELFP